MIFYRASKGTHLSGCCNEIVFDYSCYICDEPIECLFCNREHHKCSGDDLSTDIESYPQPVEHAQDHA